MKGIQSNGFMPIIAQAISDMEAERGEFSSIDEINLAELGRGTGLSRVSAQQPRDYPKICVNLLNGVE